MYEQTKIKPQGKMLFEISWEVCNKVGGIYSVITSKAELTKKYYEDYTFIGPYFKNKADEDFSEEKQVPLKYDKIFTELRNEGIIAHYGTWLAKGDPKTILLEFENLRSKKDEIKKEFWESHGVDSLFSQWEFEEPMLFSYAAAVLLLKLERDNLIEKGKTILHSHEWMTGFAILKLKKERSTIKTVFTTHATMLGRSICGNNQDLYGMLGKFDPVQKAIELGVRDKFSAEKASANAADVFTTVSEITGREAEFILGRKPEVLVLNGLDMSAFPTQEETSIKHVTMRETIREFLAYTFFPYYNFKLEHNLTFFLASRLEFENKGIDIFIEALGMLNNELKKQKSDRTIAAFFCIAVPNGGAKAELVENKNYYRHIKNYVHNKSEELQNKIVNDFLSSGSAEEDILFTKEFLHEMKKDTLRFKRKGSPILCTHKINDEDNNVIIKAFRNCGLNNTKEDNVKVILFPAYLDGNDSLLNLEYYDFIAGSHLGVFPSYYEPWGYTPLESAALGVPSITTDLAGFGRFIRMLPEYEKQGIYVLRRDEIPKRDSTQELFKIMKMFSSTSRAERVELKIKAKELAMKADWNELIVNYITAHNLAIEK